MKKSSIGILAVLAVGSAATIGIMSANEKNNNTLTDSTTAIVSEGIKTITAEETQTVATSIELTTQSETLTTTPAVTAYTTTLSVEETSLSSSNAETEHINTTDTTGSSDAQSDHINTNDTTEKAETEDETIISTFDTTTSTEIAESVNYVDSSTGQLRIHFIDVGQGDSSFLELPNGKTMLLDAGEIEQGDKVVAYIFEQGYDTVNYVVATHAHSDHIGGLSQVLTNLNVDEVIMTEDKSDSQVFNNLFTSIYVSGASLHYVLAGDTIINENNLLVEVVAPKALVADDTNNNSVVLKLTYGNTKFLFTGDASKAEEDGIWTNIKCDLLKIGHHGSKSSSSANFLKKVNPTYAIISCGLGNSYGHPTEEVLKRLEERRIKVFRTDLQGTIIVTSDGQGIQINKEPVAFDQTAVTTAITTQQTPSVTESGEEITYVLNTNTKKIHYPWCSSVKDIKDKNKDYTTDYNSAISSGYKPCGRCHPTG